VRPVVSQTFNLSEGRRAFESAGPPATGKDRYLREAAVVQIVEGTNQVQRMVIGHALSAGRPWGDRPWPGGAAAAMTSARRR
jgi:hypothetical protein